ncbi:hypothetical protein K3495_g14192 [Podosphaera aphanis]|nr:hypothetical protein K3495_g14192 [Podosphaera aphanis]
MSTSEILKALRDAPRLEKPSFIRWKFLVEQVFHNLHIENYIFTVIPQLQIATAVDVTVTKNTLIKDQDGNIKAALAQLVPEEIFYLIHGKKNLKRDVGRPQPVL